MSLPEWQLLRPAWLLALLPLALGLWRLARDRTGVAAWRGVVDRHLLPHLLVGADGRPGWLPLLLLLLGGLGGIVALAGPVWERLPQPAYRTQAERVLVLDLSATMNATDLAPSRLAQARFEMLDLLRHYREGRTGLIAYGHEPYVVSPLTTDTNTIAAQVPSLATDLLPVQGPKRTGLALAAAGRLLRQAGSTRGRVILLTDTLDNPAAALDAARALHAQGYRLSVLGIGTPAGATVPMPGGGFLKDADGAILLPKLDRAALQALANAGGGRYLTATRDDRDIEALSADESGPWQPVAGAESTLADQWHEEGPWLLLALLPLAAVAFRRGWIAPLLLVLLLLPPPPASAFSWSDLWARPDQQAARLLEQGDAQQAARTFRRPDWRAAAAYAAGDYRDTLAALADSENPQAWYNRGNALARLGDYEAALAQYDRVLAHQPDNVDARHNRGLVRRLLEQQQQAAQGSTAQQGEAQDNGGSTQPPGQEQEASGNSATAQGGDGSTQPQAQGPGSSAAAQDGEGSAQPQGEQPASRQQADGDSPAQDDTRAAAPDRAGAAPQAGQAGAPQEPGAQEDSADAPPAATAGPDRGSQPAPQTPGAAPPAARGDEPAAAGLQAGGEPGPGDLLDPSRGAGPAQAAATSPEETPSEAQQALEHQLNRVPDDPAGLLRQRFLLQHLRRSGQL
jgi:Ca-activated chloride channel family protein